MFLHIYTKYIFSHLLIKCKQICEINQVNSFMQKTRCPRLRWSTRCYLEHLKSCWRTSIIRFYSWVHADVSKMFQFKSDCYADNIICKEKGCIRWQKMQNSRSHIFGPHCTSCCTNETPYGSCTVLTSYYIVGNTSESHFALRCKMSIICRFNI